MRFVTSDELLCDEHSERYFAEWAYPGDRDVPVILRQLPGPHGPHDESWRPVHRTWRRDHKLSNYRLGYGEFYLEELTKDQALSYIAKLNSAVDEHQEAGEL